MVLPLIWEVTGAMGPCAARFIAELDEAVRDRGGWQRPNWAATSPSAEIAQMIGVAIFNKCGHAYRKLLQRSTPGATSKHIFSGKL